MHAANIPAHIGIIMDGNGRWAKKRNQLRTQGHLEGLSRAKKIVKAASDMGIRYVTLYVFSTENWKRTAEEVSFIMGLVKQYLRSELAFFRENSIRIRHAGDMETLPPDIAGEIRDVCAATAGFPGLSVILALNYGGRNELVRAVKRILREQAEAEQITEDSIGLHLDNPDVPDPDLIIRTAGEFRTSNFLLWEAAYAEYYISDKLWPDWTEEDLAEALRAYGNRDRRFGGVRQ
ncbi:MAG: di-trans,poly-cis-decaprenylcistransferase [Spirochaetaceae bacterium]|jgi:undecaprenyl diphosphate synthase|nr:di-trans,poly-cis-decaprenylcistransferase [Spirochaetaceae bacterium]